MDYTDTIVAYFIVTEPESALRNTTASSQKPAHGFQYIATSVK